MRMWLGGVLFAAGVLGCGGGEGPLAGATVSFNFNDNKVLACVKRREKSFHIDGGIKCVGEADR